MRAEDSATFVLAGAEGSEDKAEGRGEAKEGADEEEGGPSLWARSTTNTTTNESQV
jgi:hypothetical protein